MIRRMLAGLLMLAMLLSCVSCGGPSLVQTGEGETQIRTTAPATAETGEGKHDNTGFAAGYAKADITPKTTVPLAGYGNTSQRMSNNVLDGLFLTCVALSDGEGNILLLYSLDISNISSTLGTQLRNLAMKASGVPEENIFINASHTHSGPDTSSSDGGVTQWKTNLYKSMTEATKAAIADLDHCEAEVGRAETDRLNFTRRYYAEDGFVTDNFDSRTNGGAIISHEFEADAEMQVVRFKRTNQKDIVLVNWQCHPHRTGGSTKYDISADIVGAMRSCAESELGLNFQYFQGAAGNINPTSRINGEARFSGYQEIGNAMYQTMVEAMNNAQPLELGAVRAQHEVLVGQVNHTLDSKLAEARHVASIWSSTNNRTETMEVAKKYGISSPYEANAIVTRAGMAETQDIDIYTYAFGDFAVASAPFEMFSNTGQYVKETSPFGMTFYCGYSNNSLGYMPAATSFPNKGYEVVICRFVQGTAEQIAELQLNLLNNLHNQ